MWVNKTKGISKACGGLVLTVCVMSVVWLPSPVVVFEHGTSIVAIRTPAEVAVAADSRSLYSTSPGEPKTTCKINRSGKIYFAIAGNKRESTNNFDSVQIVDRILKADTSLPKKMTIIEESLISEWEKLLPFVQREEPVWYQKNMVDRLLWACIVFGADTNGTYLYVRSLKEKRPWSGKVFVEHRTDCIGKCKILAPIGDDTALDAYLERNPRWFEQRATNVVTAIVQAEIDLGLPGIGGPVDVLRVSKQGTSDWIQKKPECPK